MHRVKVIHLTNKCILIKECILGKKGNHGAILIMYVPNFNSNNDTTDDKTKAPADKSIRVFSNDFR